MKTFNGIDGFLAELARLQAKSHQIQSAALRDGGEIVQAEANAELGHYQTAAGPAGEWSELADFTKRERERFGFDPNKPGLMTGELRDHIDLSYNQHKAIVGVPHEIVGDGSEANPVRDIGDVAIRFEQGERNQPPRSFLARSLFVKQKEAVKAMALRITDEFCGHAHRAREAKGHDDIPF